MTETSVEYRIIRKNRTLLKNAMVNDVVYLSDELLGLDMISDDNHTDLMDNALNKRQRVEKLMTYIENRVKLNPDNFTNFVKVLKTKEEYYSKALQVLEIYVPGINLPQSPHSELIQLVRQCTNLSEELSKMHAQGSHYGHERRIKELEEHMKETNQRIENNVYWVVLSKGFQFLFYLVAFMVLIFLIVVVATVLVYLLVIVVPSAIFIIMQLVKYSYTNFLLLLLLKTIVGAYY